MQNLWQFFIRHFHWFLFLLLEVASGVMLFQYNNYQSSVWVSSANMVAGKVYELQANIEQFFSLTRNNEELSLRNFYLERQLDQLRRLYAEETGDTTAAERAELQALSQYKLIPAKVISSTLDRLIRGRGYFGYLTWKGGDPSIAYVEDIPRHAKFRRGEWIETSGYSSIFPHGISVGKILQVYNSRDGLSYRLKVHLSTDFGCLRDVCVISDSEIGERLRLQNIARDSLSKTH